MYIAYASVVSSAECWWALPWLPLTWDIAPTMIPSFCLGLPCAGGPSVTSHLAEVGSFLFLCLFPLSCSSVVRHSIVGRSFFLSFFRFSVVRHSIVSVSLFCCSSLFGSCVHACCGLLPHCTDLPCGCFWAAKWLTLHLAPLPLVQFGQRLRNRLRDQWKTKH